MATVQQRHPELFDTVNRTSPRGKQRSVPMEVLVFGYPRTGTASKLAGTIKSRGSLTLDFTAMQAALGILGLRCYHSTLWVSSNLGDSEMWQEAYDAKYWNKGTPYGRHEFDQLLHDFHAVSEIPACSFVQELLEAYPEAKVILVERDVESWYKSFDQNVISNCWNPFTRIVSRMDRWTLNPIRVTMDKWMKGALGCHSAAEMRAKARSLYTDHNALVRHIAPRERFLDYRLDQGWEPLCRLLGKPIPDEAFPRLNEAAWFQEKIGLLVKRGVWSVLNTGLVYGGAAGIGIALTVTYSRSCMRK
ncbi:MAG: hypothetical protein Q9159_002652 [Coniocarpon cinnabarinum]